MNYYVYFRDEVTGQLVKYKLIQGFDISEEYNETLDSGTIKISECPQVDFDPYDDAFIVSEFCGIKSGNDWVPNYDKEFVFKGYPVDSTNYTDDELPYFYKHFLIDEANEEMLKLDNSLYKYTIKLFSETKGLETVQAPNISVTQPLKNKISTITYLNRFLELYNKKIKVATSANDLENWEYRNKYSLATEDNGMLEAPQNVFGNSFCPDFTLNNPSLRQILEKLFITKDRIPVVKDDKIYALDITARRGNFNLTKGQINYITGSKSSDNFCTDLKRTYSDALTEENSTRYVEYLGFRNEDDSIMTLDNLRIETRFPIYKINRIYMCYFKKIFFHHLNSENKIETSTKYFLCKQDITPFIKLNSERNVLSMDIDDFASKINQSTGSAELTKYKMVTIGYDIGSRFIDGWGTRYSRPTHNFFWQNETKTYIENLFCWIDARYPYGIYEGDYLLKKLQEVDPNVQSGSFFAYGGSINNIESVNVNYSDVVIDNVALKLKHLFFEMDYQGFYNGTIIHSKGLGKDNITINDNPSSSLTLLELDGLAQKEKLARYGNKGIQIPARYTKIGDIQSLGSVYNHGIDQDIIIFHKQYSIYDNVINCVYYGSKDYVLKNYFTSVYARHRTYNLMGYAESICRAENQKVYLLFSKNKEYLDNNNIIRYKNFSGNFYKSFLSFFKETKKISYNKYDSSEKINYGCFYKEGNPTYYLTDLNMFTSGDSLCLNIAMHDNITSGTKISKIANKFKVFSFNEEQYAGSSQEWSWLSDNQENGQIERLGFLFGHIESSLGNYDYIDDDVIYPSLEAFNKEALYERIFNLPEIDLTSKNVFYYTNDEISEKCTKLWGSIEPENNNDTTEFLYVSCYVVKTSSNDLSLRIRTFANTDGNKENNTTNYSAYVKASVMLDSEEIYIAGSENSFATNNGLITYNIPSQLFSAEEIKLSIYSNDNPGVIALNFPFSKSAIAIKNEISFIKNIYKDNKERYDLTLQFEPITDDGVFVGPWLSKLSDLYGVYHKVNKNRASDYYERISGRENYLAAMDIDDISSRDYRVIIMAIKKTEIDNLEVNQNVNIAQSVKMSISTYSGSGMIFFEFKPTYISSISKNGNSLDSITFSSHIGRAYNNYTRVEVFENQNCTFTKQELDTTATTIRKSYNDIKQEFLTYSNLLDGEYEILVYYPEFLSNGAYEKYVSLIGNKLTDNFLANASQNSGKFGDLTKFYTISKDKPAETIFKNMYYFYTDSDFKNYMVSDQYTDETLPSNFYQFNQIFSGPRIKVNPNVADTKTKFMDENGVEEETGKNILWFEWDEQDEHHLKIYHYYYAYLIWHLRGAPFNGGSVQTKSILVYYKDESGKYNFVFGFNPIDGLSTDIYLSSISYKDLSIYDKNTNLKIGDVPNKV